MKDNSEITLSLLEMDSMDELFICIQDMYAKGSKITQSASKMLYNELTTSEQEECLSFLETAATYEIWDNGEQGQQDFDQFINFLKA